MDPAHVPYAHYGVMEILPSRNSSILNNPYVLPISFDVFIYDWNQVTFTVKADREGGTPIEFMIKKLDVNGFNIVQFQEWSRCTFIAPYLVYASLKPEDQANGSESSAGTRKVIY